MVQSLAVFGAAAQQGMEKFDPDYMGSNFLERFCEMWEVRDNRKVLLFLSLIGQELYAVIRDLVSPESVKEQSFDALFAKLKDQFETSFRLIVILLLRGVSTYAIKGKDIWIISLGTDIFVDTILIN